LPTISVCEYEDAAELFKAQVLIGEIFDWADERNLDYSELFSTMANVICALHALETASGSKQHNVLKGLHSLSESLMEEQVVEGAA
tara:strand:+ start:442 stop:699 length:258 start_codon:yes stop_codon:yes gene_type:complete